MKTYYHVTETRKVPSIRKHGLLLSHRKNVPLSKKKVNYVMGDILQAGQFASQMSWGWEGDVSIIHVRLNPSKVKQDKNIGAIGGSWFEYHEDIKPSQIVKVERWNDPKVKQRHMKLMDKRFKKGGTETIYL